MELGYQEGGGRVPALDVWQQRFETDPEYDPTLCFIALDAEGIVGVCQCWTSAYIKNLVVHPRAQGQGLGRALLLHAFKVFQQRREGFVDLKVLEDNLRAQRLYESAGMRVVRREPVPPDTASRAARSYRKGPEHLHTEAIRHTQAFANHSPRMPEP